MKKPRVPPGPMAWVMSFLAFQGAWFACVLGAARGEPGEGIAIAVLVCGVQLALSPARGADLALAGGAVGLGLAWDTAMLRTGVVAYASPGPIEGWAPAWILALWLLFATLLRGPLRFLHGRWVLAALLGGGGGALSYLSAVRLGAGSFRDLREAMLVLGLGWAVMTPLLIEAARRFERRRVARMAPSKCIELKSPSVGCRLVGLQDCSVQSITSGRPCSRVALPCAPDARHSRCGRSPPSPICSRPDPHAHVSPDVLLGVGDTEAIATGALQRAPLADPGANL